MLRKIVPAPEGLAAPCTTNSSEACIANALRGQNSQLRERIDHLLLEADQYHRALSTRPLGSR